MNNLIKTILPVLMISQIFAIGGLGISTNQSLFSVDESTESLFLDKNLKNSTLLISFLYEHREISTNRNIFFKLKEFLKLIQFNAKYIRYNL